MQLYSTNNKNNIVDLREAVLHSLPQDKGLYMPCEVPVMATKTIAAMKSMQFSEVATTVAKNITKNALPESILTEIVEDAINFPAPIYSISDQIGTLELFHGPSLAFKDFGARFMSRLMSFFNRNEDNELTILVATSGDTGGAVAAGFYDTPGIEVVILYPRGGVSDLQEKQLTTLGKNITACEIKGTFDDCQAMVKQAFLDPQLSVKYRLSSANSINIARLIPQSFYYFEAFRQMADDDRQIVFSVPSGNFGNLTAGLLAKRMGLPVSQFIAATNINKIVPEYLNSGIFKPLPSKSTISNAMDVGNPSNFPRMMALYNHSLESIRKDVKGFYCDDDITRMAMRKLHHEYNYIADPHGAIGFQALLDYHLSDDQYGIFLETAHPGKFLPTVEATLESTLDLPESLLSLKEKTKKATELSNQYQEFQNFLLSRK